MCIRAARAHLGRDPDRLHDLLLAGSAPHRRPGVTADAIRTLRGVCYGHRDQLLCLLRQRTVGEDLLAEALKRVVDLRCSGLAASCKLPG